MKKSTHIIILVVVVAAVGVAGYFIGARETKAPTVETAGEAPSAVSVPAQNTELLTVQVYFNNSTMDPEFSCNKVFPATRLIPKTAAPATAALNELFKGPSDTEKAQGFSTSVPTGARLNSLRISDGAAYADFNEAAESGGGSCSMAARTAQIQQTLLQFPTVKSVLLSINGRRGDIFQP